MLVYVRIYVHVLKRQKKGKLRKSDHSAAKSHGMTITGYFRKSFTSVLTGDPGVCVCVLICMCMTERWKKNKKVCRLRKSLNSNTFPVLFAPRV